MSERAFGHCTAKRDGDQVIIVQADPVIRVSLEMLTEIADATGCGRDRHADLIVNERNEYILTLRGDNRTVIYRLDLTDIEAGAALAEWPD